MKDRKRFVRTSKHRMISTCRLVHISTLIGFSVLSGSAARSAWADEADVFNFSIQESINRDTNLFRLDTGEENAATREKNTRSDTSFTTTAQLSARKQFGRHAAGADLSQSYTKFSTFDQLDYSGQDFRIFWQGGFARDSGYDILYTRRRTLESFSERSESRKNIITTDNLTLDGHLRTWADYMVVGSISKGHTTNSGEGLDAADIEYQNGDVGVRYDPGSGNYVDLRYRFSQVDYPNYILPVIATTDNSYSQNEIRLSSLWIYSYASRLDANISLIQRKHKNLDFRDFEDVAGSIQYTWRYNDKFKMQNKVYRDVGASSDSSALYAKTDGLSIQPIWDVSSKVQIQGALDTHYRRFEGDLAAELSRRYGGSPIATKTRKEHTNSLGLSALYVPLRNWTTKAGVNWERRRSNINNENYNDLGVSASVRYTF